MAKIIYLILKNILWSLLLGVLVGGAVYTLHRGGFRLLHHKPGFAIIVGSIVFVGGVLSFLATLIAVKIQNPGVQLSYELLEAKQTRWLKALQQYGREKRSWILTIFIAVIFFGVIADSILN